MVSLSRSNSAMFLLIVGVLLIAPSFANAQFGPLINPDQCSGTLSFPPGEKYCTLCDGLNVLKTGMNMLIKLGLAVAVLMVTYGGILIAVGGANPGKIEEGRKMITGAIVGFAIALLAWLIINQVFYLIVTDSVTGRPWNQITCPPEERLGAIGGPGGGGGVGGEGGGRQQNDIEESNRIRERLKNESGRKITTNANCPQTCLDGLTETAITGVIDFQRRSGCDLVISGGTEVGGRHAAGDGGHLSGDKIDLRPTNCIDNFIAGPVGTGANGFLRTGVRGDGATLYLDTQTEYIYARETDHWDIKYQ